MNSPDEGSNLDRLRPLTEAEELMWVESKPGEPITEADAAARLAEIRARAAADSVEEREEGPLAINIPPTIPAHPRPGTRTIVATTAEYGRWRLSRVSLDLDEAIIEETEDYRCGLGKQTGAEADAYALDQPDVALWEGERCLAVIRPRVGGDPEVTRFDGVDNGRALPLPSTDAERMVWGLIQEYGAAKCHEAIVEKLLPGLRPRRPEPLTTSEQLAVDFVRRIGQGEAMDRLMMMGPYQVIYEAIKRLGSDAVAELRRIIAAGESPVSVEAATVVGAPAKVEAAREARN